MDPSTQRRLENLFRPQPIEISDPVYVAPGVVLYNDLPYVVLSHNGASVVAREMTMGEFEDLRKWMERHPEENKEHDPT